MEPTDLLPRRDSVVCPPQPMPMDAEIIELPPRTEDVIELYKRFLHELDNLPPEARSGPRTTRLQLFDELSFSELFRLNALWHRVERPHPLSGTDANARHSRLQERQWQNFYYYWLQPRLRERWAQNYGLVRAGGDVSWKRLLGKTNIRTYWDARVDYPPCCDHATLWRMPITKGDNPHLAQVLVTQPYGYSLDEMIAFAAEKGLWFWISERPAWHFPKGVHFVEWAAPGSAFARRRDTSAMHDLFQTRQSYTPGC